MNKVNKEILERELDFFLKTNDLVIKSSDSYSSSQIGFKKRKETDTDRNYLHYRDRLLYEVKLDGLFGVNYVFKFISHLLSKKELQNIAIEFIKSKEVSVKNYNYDEYTSSFLDILKNYKESYFDYISRGKFLESNLKRLDKCFDVIEDQLKREVLIECCLSLKTFKSLESKTLIYNLIQKKIRNKDKYNEYFEDIKLVKDTEELLFKSNIESVVHFNLDVKQLNGIDLNKNYKTSIMLNIVAVLVKALNNGGIPSLGITEVISEKVGDSIRVDFFGNNLDKEMIESFFNKVLKMTFKLDTYLTSSIDGIIHEALVVSNVKKLNNVLTLKEDRVKTNKI
jgi:hypothetical protein